MEASPRGTFEVTLEVGSLSLPGGSCDLVSKVISYKYLNWGYSYSYPYYNLSY